MLSLLVAAALAAVPGHPTVAFLTDFGVRSESVATCKAVMLGIAPSLTIVDVTHEVPPFDIATGAVLLERTVKYFPRGTVFVAVVDPGVGTSRRAIAARTRAGHVLVGPDNGVLSLALAKEGAIEVRELTNRALFNRLDPVSGIFHGRDVFSPVAAHLARGEAFASVGPVAAEWVKLPQAPAEQQPGKLRGEATLLDLAFGNIATNIPAGFAESAGFHPGDAVSVTIGGRTQDGRFARTFGEVAVGELVVYPEDQGFIGVALREGDLVKALQVARGAAVAIVRK